MSKDSKTNSASQGDIRIHESVITTIVRKVAGETEGVSRISGNSLVDNIAELVGSKRIQDRAISVDMGDSQVSIEVTINLLFGHKLPVVAQALQQAVQKEVEELTGLKVSGVDVIIRDIDEPVEKKS